LMKSSVTFGSRYKLSVVMGLYPKVAYLLGCS
jgi:hypothetical protein